MRLQLALNVDDLDEAIAFYSDLFATAPAKVQPGYANWAIAEPPLKLVIFENAAAPSGSINHLGVEVDTDDEVRAAAARLAAAGRSPGVVDEANCCFADKVETWVDGPDGTRWEWYRKVADTEDTRTMDAGPVCCAPAD